jgi:hypothetical protein
VGEFTYSYGVTDLYDGNLTDYDLPGTYNPNTDQWVSPQLVWEDTGNPGQYTLDNPVWALPQYRQWASNWGLSLDALNRTSTLAITAQAITSTDTTIPVNTVVGMPIRGTASIGIEQIAYSGVDYNTNSLTGCARGLDGTIPRAYNQSTPVSIRRTTAWVTWGGRGYTSTPRIQIIQPPPYPQPRSVLTLTAVLESDRIVDVTVSQPGQGYAVEPLIVVEPSAIYDITAVDTLNNTLTVSSGLQTGDSVYYTDNGETIPPGLSPYQYYWVRVIDSTTVALYLSWGDALNITGPVVTTPTVIDGRVVLRGNGGGKLNCAARIETRWLSTPQRTLNTTIKFDRTTYELNTGWSVKPWDMDLWDQQDPNAARRIYDSYKPTASMPGLDLGQLMSGVQYPNNTYIGLKFEVGVGWDDLPWDDGGWSGAVARNDLIDTFLTAPSFTESDDTFYTVSGGQFTDGYAPEELVAGVVSDRLDMTVTTQGTDLRWRVSVNKSGNIQVWNANPYTYTTLASDWVSTGRIDDVIELVDVSKLVLSGATRGVIFIGGEYIGFTSIDLSNNTITGLQRGLGGTIQISGALAGEIAQGVLDRDEMSQSFVRQWWYGPPTLPSANTTLQTNTSAPALFLQNNTP